MINASQKKILLFLLEGDKTVKELSIISNISQRLVYKNIHYCNDYFGDYFKIIKKDKLYRLEIRMEKEAFIKLLETHTGLTQEERRSYLIFKLLVDKNFNMEGERKYLDVSRGTIKSDMEYIKENIKKYNLNLEYVKNRYQISESSNSLKYLLLMKNFYLFLKNTSLSQLHKESIEYILKKFDIQLMKDRLINVLKKYAIPITNDVVNFLLSYQLVRKIKNMLVPNRKEDFFRYYLYFFNNKNTTDTMKNLLSSNLETSSKLVLSDSNARYNEFILKLSSEFSLEDISLSEDEKNFFFRNLNFLFLKQDLLESEGIGQEELRTSFKVIKNIFKETYDIQVLEENYCFVFLFQNIILNKKLKQLKDLKVVIFIDFLNRELIDFLEKEIYIKFKLNSVIFESKDDFLSYEDEKDSLIIITNYEIDRFENKKMGYSPERHYEFMYQLEEYIIFY